MTDDLHRLTVGQAEADQRVFTGGVQIQELGSADVDREQQHQQLYRKQEWLDEYTLRLLRFESERNHVLAKENFDAYERRTPDHGSHLGQRFGHGRGRG